MKFKGQGKKLPSVGFNIKKILQTAVGGGVPAPQNKPVSAHVWPDRIRLHTLSTKLGKYKRAPCSVANPVEVNFLEV